MSAANQTWVDSHSQTLHYTWPEQFSNNYGSNCSPVNYTHHYPAHYSVPPTVPIAKAYDYEGSYGSNFLSTANYLPPTFPRDHLGYYDTSVRVTEYDSSSPVIDTKNGSGKLLESL